MAAYVNPDYVAEPGKVNVKKGLEGAVVDTTAVSKVNPETNSLVYRGYRVPELAEQCSFEEVAYLLFFGELPNSTQLKEFKEKEQESRTVSQAVIEMIQSVPKTAHPMDVIRTSVSILGAEDPRIWDSSPETNAEKALSLLAKIPTCVALHYRIRQGLLPIPESPSLSLAENFFHMCFEKVPAKEIVKAFDASLTLYAEHSFNASTFTARVVASTLSDLYSATVAGIGALKGPLHGGANEQVMHMMLEIGDPSKAEAWMMEALLKKRKVMGFGHRVYKAGDSRVPTMHRYAKALASLTGQEKWMEIYDALARVILEKKNIYPNLDFPAGPAYYMMGFEIDFFTPIFVMARTAGWSAHIMEQLASNRLIRPLSEYVGPGERDVVPLSHRS